MGKSANTNDFNVNVITSKEVSLNNNDLAASYYRSCGKPCGKVRISTEVADARAQLLIDKFHAPQCRLFFLKCIYHLSEDTIQKSVELAMRPNIKSHIRYFVAVAKSELEAQGF